MEEGLAVLATELGVGIAENEADCGEEVGLAGSIAAYDDVVFGRKGFDYCLVFVAVRLFSRGVIAVGLVHLRLEALDDDLFDIHRANGVVVLVADIVTDNVNDDLKSASSFLMHR